MGDIAKAWEQHFRMDWLSTFPNSFVFRLNDQMSLYKTVSANPCDFICYNKPLIFLAECKTHKGASIPFDAISQYDALLKYRGIPGLRSGVFVWLREKDVVFYVPVSTIEKIKADGESSVGIRHFGKYKIYQIPAEKKRVFMKCDFSVMMNTEDGD